MRSSNTEAKHTTEVKHTPSLGMNGKLYFQKKFGTVEDVAVKIYVWAELIGAKAGNMIMWK